MIIDKDAIKKIEFGNGKCCFYDNITKFDSLNNEKYLRVTGVYLQSYKYFHKYRQLMLDNILQFSDDYKKKAKQKILSMLHNNNDINIKKRYINSLN